MENIKSDPSSGRDSNKIYFLIVVIIALLGTNAYLFFKDKKSNDRVVTLTDEKSRMSVEIDKIEAELDKATNENVLLTDQMKKDSDLARKKIDELRVQLKKGELTQHELARAQKEIKDLRYFVSRYSSDISELKQKNQVLTAERDSLKSTVRSVSEQASRLEQQNSELSGKVKVASALKVAGLAVKAYKVRSSGRESEVSRASAAHRLKIVFTVADNTLARKGMHDVFIRIIDPSGNLIVSDTESLFSANGDDLQFTYKTAIDFDNSQGKMYAIDWNNPKEFQKGNYTVLLYSDGYSMGNESISLR